MEVAIKEKTEKKYNKKYNDIFVTNDYDVFKYIKGNRQVNEYNKASLQKSMLKKQEDGPIMINENFEIIDGQHRYEVCKENNLPVYYFISPGKNIEDVKILNNVSRTWKISDYLNMYVENEKEEYLDFQKLVTYYNITEKNLIDIISKVENKLTKDVRNEFILGELTFDFDKAKDFLEKLEAFKGFKEYHSSKFIAAFLVLSQVKTYNHSNMINRLEKYVGQLK